MSGNMRSSTARTLPSHCPRIAWPAGVSWIWMMRPCEGSGERSIQPFASICLTISLADCGDTMVRVASCAFESAPWARNTDSAVYCGTVTPAGAQQSRRRLPST